MQEFTFHGPIEMGDEKHHDIKVQVTVTPDDESNVELVKICGVIEREAKDTLYFTMMLKDKLVREYMEKTTDTIDTGEAN